LLVLLLLLLIDVLSALSSCLVSQNGHDATKALRLLGHRELVVGLTGNALDDDVAAFIAAGADCVLSKPLREQDLDMLLDFIRSHGSHSNEENGRELQSLVALKQRGTLRF
jgi:CheY-like chemotaxis protein